MSKRLSLSLVLAVLLLAGAALSLPAIPALASGVQPASVEALPLCSQALTVTNITRAGITFDPATQGVITQTTLYLPNDGKTFVALYNNSGNTFTATFNIGVTVDGLSVTGRAVAVDAGDTVFAGPFPPSLYNQQAGTYAGDIQVTTDVTSDVYIKAFRLP
jgi:hypothetical protein